MEKLQEESVATRLYVAGCYLIRQGFPVEIHDMLKAALENDTPAFLGQKSALYGIERYFLTLSPSQGKFYVGTKTSNAWSQPGSLDGDVYVRGCRTPLEKAEVLATALNEVGLYAVELHLSDV